MLASIEVIINEGSGTAGGADDIKIEVEEAFKSHNLDANISVAASGEDLLKIAERAARSDAEIVVAGGGDGTISAVAAALIGTDKTLGVLPLGTLNHFSKDIGIPPELSEAVKIIAARRTRELDAAEVNGQIFINNSSIGLYPQMVKSRERQQEKLGRSKWHAAFWAAMKILRRHAFLHIKLNVAGRELKRRTPFVFIGNNQYKMDFLNIGTRERLDDGQLSVYLLHKSGRRGLLALIARTAFGLLRQARDFEEINTEEITIETGRDKILVAFDGEVREMETPLCYKIHPKALRVIVPE